MAIVLSPGEIDQAFDRLGRACDAQSEALIRFALDPMLDSLRPDPRFARILARVGLDFQARRRERDVCQ